MEYKITTFEEAKDKQELLKDYLEKCEWESANLLAKFIKEKSFFTPNDKIYFLLNGNDVVSFLTLAHQDCIDDKNLTPWIGFVYTDEKYRGHRFSEKLIMHALNVAKDLGYSKVYLATDHIGLYEKYGFEFWRKQIDVFNDECRIYFYNLRK